MPAGQVPMTQIVSQDALDSATAALRALSDAQIVIQKLANLGHPVEHYRTMSAHWDERLRAILKEFGNKT